MESELVCEVMLLVRNVKSHQCYVSFKAKLLQLAYSLVFCLELNVPGDEAGHLLRGGDFHQSVQLVQGAPRLLLPAQPHRVRVLTQQKLHVIPHD